MEGTCSRGSPPSSPPRIDFRIVDAESAVRRALEVRAVIGKWRSEATAALISVLLLLLHLTVLSPLFAAFVPFIVTDALATRNAVRAIGRNWKSYKLHIYTKRLIASGSGILLKTLVCVYFLSGWFPLWWAAVPPASVELLRYSLGGFPLGECVVFSGPVRTLLRLAGIATVLTVSGKLDGYIDCSWTLALIPCWGVLSLFATISLCVFVFLMIHLLPSKRDSSPDILCTFWLLWTLSGFTATATFALLAFASTGDGRTDTGWLQLALDSQVAYFASFLVFTKTAEERLVLWWDSFFGTDEEEEDLVEFVQIPSTPNSPNQRGVLRRVSGVFFQQGKAAAATVISPHTFATRNTEEHEKVMNVSALEVAAESNSPCLVCYEGKRDGRLLPCGHGAICFNCALAMKETQSLCHSCGKGIEAVEAITSAGQ